MPLPFIREFRLGGSRGDGRHPYVNPNGAFLGRGVPLLEKDGLGCWHARPRTTLEKLFVVGYGVPVDLGWRIAQLGYVAQALNRGDLCLASISLVRTELPPLPGRDRAQAMAKADGHLIKSNPDWEDEPRVPAGSPDGGQWTTGEGGSRLKLPPGERIDELSDLLEWIANMKPDDEPAIRREIKRLYYDVGDTHGGDAMNRAVSDVLENGGNRLDREGVLEEYEAYTRTDPAEVAMFGRNLISGALLSVPELLPETPPSGVSPWKLGWGARGQVVNEILGGDPAFPSNTPVIDAFPEGNAISIKSIDLNAATYQDTGRLLVRINNYVDQLAQFNRLNWGSIEINPEDITGKTLRLAIPEDSMTSAQRTAMSIARARAEELGVDIEVYRVR